MATVLLPWTLSGYARRGDTPTLLAPWLARQVGVRFVRPKWGHELDDADAAVLREAGPLDEAALVSRLAAEVEFHHTLPPTHGTRPYLLYLDVLEPLFEDVVATGWFGARRVRQAVALRRAQLESDRCLVIWTPRLSTLEAIDRTFASAAIRRKLRHLPPSFPPGPRPPRRIGRELTLLFAPGDRKSGGPDALAALATVRRFAPEARLIVAGVREAVTGAPGFAALADQIVFAAGGHRERLLRSADALVGAASAAEVLEAMRNGCIPIVASPDELVRLGVTGLILSDLPAEAAMLASPDGRAAFRAGMLGAFEARFVSEGGFGAVAEAIQRSGAALTPIGDLAAVDVDFPADFSRPGREDLMVIGDIAIASVGRDVLTMPIACDGPDVNGYSGIACDPVAYFPDCAAAVSDALSALEGDLLSGLMRKDFVTEDEAGLLIPASGEPGHAVYGPYRPVRQGPARIVWRAEAAGAGGPDDHLLTVEVVVGDAVLAARDVTRRELAGSMEETFTVPVWPRERLLEFRLSHHGLADIRLTDVRLVPEAWSQAETVKVSLNAA